MCRARVRFGVWFSPTVNSTHARGVSKPRPLDHAGPKGRDPGGRPRRVGTLDPDPVVIHGGHPLRLGRGRRSRRDGVGRLKRRPRAGARAVTSAVAKGVEARGGGGGGVRREPGGHRRLRRGGRVLPRMRVHGVPVDAVDAVDAIQGVHHAGGMGAVPVEEHLERGGVVRRLSAGAGAIPPPAPAVPPSKLDPSERGLAGRGGCLVQSRPKHPRDSDTGRAESKDLRCARWDRRRRREAEPPRRTRRRVRTR